MFSSPESDRTDPNAATWCMNLGETSEHLCIPASLWIKYGAMIPAPEYVEKIRALSTHAVWGTSLDQ